MVLKQILEFLLENGYLIQLKGKYVFTPKFIKELAGTDSGSIPGKDMSLSKECSLPIVPQEQDWTQLYIRFIKEAEVPPRGSSSTGTYDLNKYSEKAMKVFRRLLEREGIQYPVLVKSTLLYYKTHSRYQYTITRYIEEGFWRIDYQELLLAAKENSLESHIETQINHDKEFSKFKLG